MSNSKHTRLIMWPPRRGAEKLEKEFCKQCNKKFSHGEQLLTKRCQNKHSHYCLICAIKLHILDDNDERIIQ